jgi:hypothetical protein
MPKKKQPLKVLEPVEPLIREIRGERIMLDADLARIYGVPTKRLNEQVRRNLKRFPDDFVFQLTPEEADNLKSQFATSSSGHGGRRKLPWAFTEHGAIMAANVLSSRRAVEMSIHVIRAFVTLRRESGRYAELARKLSELERAQKLQGEDLEMIFAALRELEETTSWAYPEGRRLIGYHAKEAGESGTKGKSK